MNTISIGASPWQRFRAVAIGAGLLSLMVVNPVMAQERLMRTLTVTGRGTEQVATTLTQVRLGVEAQGKTADAVQQEVARRSTALVTLLKARQVEKLETTGVNLNPVYRYDNGAQTLTGYSASNSVSFRLETSKVGTLLDEAVRAGASRIDGVNFVASDAAIAAAQKVALRSATQEAQAQADAVFSSLGFTKREIVSVQINNATPPVPRPMFDVAQRAELAAPAKAPLPVVGGEQEVEASVTLQISY
ncbi:SIMPL domain-containing protein [Leptolyngbya sp. FACHB-36]|uniref:SIMPL domain-containing protein n=1 Tax=Leptolyngbya sp. FACHB-36 TaxID=2692808 RepID=UPI0016815820|nr:SIMPL domain-containing protein [Leptolyngbya sp. FACHB-36]MBD2019661.1 SIMPL domain-containing protein [Leptolyngbya sp. FACHB-36]